MSSSPYDGPDLVTTSVPITIQDSGGPHPPLLMRILDLADLLLEFYPDPDEVDYYHQVRQNITVEKDTV